MKSYAQRFAVYITGYLVFLLWGDYMLGIHIGQDFKVSVYVSILYLIANLAGEIEYRLRLRQERKRSRTWPT